MTVFSVGTIPIYWGCPERWKLFNEDGILRFFNINELQIRLDTARVYSDFDWPRKNNLDIAGNYRSCENRFPYAFNSIWRYLSEGTNEVTNA